MTIQDFEATVGPLLEARPFRPFAIEMNDGTRLDIDVALAMGYRDGHFSTITNGRGPRFFHCKDIRQVISATAERAAA